jgi:hypothetical protein
MNLNDSIGAMEYLAAMTTGWADDTAAAYAVELALLDNVEALYTAVRKIAASWTDAWRPSLGVIVDAYNVEVDAMRRTAEQHAHRKQVEAEVIPIDRGTQLAWDAYVAECARRGVEPRREVFGRWANQIAR